MVLLFSCFLLKNGSNSCGGKRRHGKELGISSIMSRGLVYKLQGDGYRDYSESIEQENGIQASLSDPLWGARRVTLTFCFSIPKVEIISVHIPNTH